MNKINDWQWQDLSETQSTNDEIKTLCEKAKQGQKFIVTTKRQNGGRGRRGRSWVSIEGNLFVSFGLEIALKDLGQAIFVIGLSLLETIKTFSPQLDVSLKWPNDVLVEGCKVSGILLEKAAGDYLVIGVGVNLVDAPKSAEMLYPAISLKEAGVETDRITFLHEFVKAFDQYLQLWQQQGFALIKEKWLKYAKNLGAGITVHTEHEQKTGKFLNVDDNGILLLSTKDGVEKIYAGDVFYLKEKEDK